MKETLAGKLPTKVLERVKMHMDDFEVLEHPPVLTCKDVVRTLKVALKQVVKCVIFEAKSGKIVVAVVPGNKRADLRKLSELTSEKRLKMLNPSQIDEKLHLTLGAISPLAIPNGAEAVLDIGLTTSSPLYCGTGIRTLSLTTSGKVLGELFAGKIADIART